MPLFSNRSIASLLAQLSGKLPQERRNDILSRLLRGSEAAIAAEWELVVFACLDKQGKIEFVPKQPGVADLDVIYTSHNTGERVIVEVTAISDKGLHEKNPVNLFADMLLAHGLKLRKTVPGGFRFQIGYIEVNGEIVLGVPKRSDMAKFFASRNFRGLVARIKKSPKTPQSLRFECRGAHSEIVYQPGAQTGGGGHIAHDVILRTDQNHIRSRLESKNRQIKRAALKLPAIVVLCDAGCRALSGMAGPGRPTWVDVIDAYLNGRSFPMPGAAMKAQTDRLNAVVVAIAREDRNFSTGHYSRRIEVKYVSKRGACAYPLGETTIEEVARTLFGSPPLRTMPINATRIYSLPRYYGGYEMTSRNGGPAVKLSLLTLQGLLAGEISYEEFARSHQHLAPHITRCVREGRMISNIRIEKCEDEDDDWVWLEFGEINPRSLFKKLKGEN